MLKMRWLFGLVIVAAAQNLGCQAKSPATSPVTGKFENLGVQLTSMVLQGTAFTKDPTGRDLVCTVIRGEPAKLLIFDIRSGELLHRLALEGAKGAWNATAATDGSVYVGSDDNGHLYRWIPGESTIRDLGQVAPDQTFVWDEVAGDDGEVFVGTYPGCNVIRYHPKDGFTDVGKGSVAPGENYVRGITYDAASKKIYAGIGAHARVIELDPKTGEKKNILPPKFADKKFAYSVDVAGGKLFALLTDGPLTLVMNPATHEVEAALENTAAQQVVSAKSPYDDKVYYVSGGKITSYDLKTRTTQPTATGNAPDISGMHWIKLDEPDFPGKTLVALTRRGRLIRYDPRTGKSASTQLNPPPESVPIQSIARGPDGKIYSSGYLVGGLSALDPKTNQHVQLGFLSQAEGIGTLGSKLYLGLYPKARLYTFDTAKPWDGKTNPQQIEELDRFDQDRPFAVLGVPSLNKVFYGTVPNYGTLGGGLTILDAATNKLDFRRNVVEDQSVVSLAYANDLIVGGTSISGGLGVEAKTKEAKLFFWDPKENRKIFEMVPISGARLITGLLVGPDKNLWGVAEGTLFAFDMNRRKVSYKKQLKLPPPEEPARHWWRDAQMDVHPDGSIYGAASGLLFRIDPATKELSILRKGKAGLLAIDDAGRIYFRDRANLWRYTP